MEKAPLFFSGPFLFVQRDGRDPFVGFEKNGRRAILDVMLFITPEGLATGKRPNHFMSYLLM